MRVRPTRLPLLNAAALVAGAILLWAVPTPAHQRQLLQIGAADYLVVVGFLNEPVYTGDRSGVDLSVLTPDPSNPLDARAPDVKLVEGLEKTLKTVFASSAACARFRWTSPSPATPWGRCRWRIVPR